MDKTQPLSLPTTHRLPNGQTVTIRVIKPSDAPLLVEMFRHLSDRTRRLRFHAYTGNLPQERIWREAVALSDLDPTRQAAVVAIHDDDAGEHVVGVARFARATPDAVEAEAAVVVRDDFQRQGLGTHLLTLLLPLAQSLGIERLFGWIMAENQHMMRIIGKTNLPVHRESHSGEMFVVISLPP
jgi:RimJ/RimL family protein N-acetyltransferase